MKTIIGLDLIRFIAALMVFFFHIGFRAFAVPADPLNSRMQGHNQSAPWPAMTWWGWVGVQIFFVISGLVIANSCKSTNWQSFLVRRITRLFPTMLICATLIAPIAVLFDGISPSETLILWLKSISFYPRGPWLAGPFWTLAVEIFFYCVVCLVIMGRIVRQMDGLAWGLTIISAAYWFGLAATDGSDGLRRLTQLLLLQHGCYFAIGITLSTIDSEKFSIQRGFLLATCVATAWLQISHVHITAPEENGTYHASNAVLPFTIWLVATGALTASLIWRNPIASAVGRHHGFVRAIGLTTYPLYLIHLHTGGPILIYALNAGLTPWSATLLAFFFSLLTAVIVAMWLEPPLNRKTMSILGRFVPKN